MEWKRWRHVTKLDPDRTLDERTLEMVCDSGTDAIMISGTQNVTMEKIEKLLEMLKGFKIPKVLEPSDPSQVTYDDFDWIFVPSVLNSPDPAFFIGKHKEWVKSGKVFWDKVVGEAYIVLNPDSAVGRLTRVSHLENEDVVAYAVCAEKYFKFPIVYLECSGSYGSVETVREVRSKLEESSLFYGGGIDCREKAREMAKYADTIVVGNVLYEKGVEKYLETVI